MAPSRLEALPAEILQRVCGYLDGQSKCHLGSFSCASRTCDTAAASLLFRTMRFRVPFMKGAYLDTDDPQVLQDPPNFWDEVNAWHALLKRRCAYSDVRCVRITELMRVVLPRQDEIGFNPPFDPPGHLDLLDENDEFRGSTKRSLITPEALVEMALPPEEEMHGWNSLARLLEQLPHLTNLYYDLSRPLPVCVFNVLSQPQSHCRLHLQTFWFRNNLRYDRQAFDPYEIQLLMSPHLSSISTRSSGYCHNGGEEYSHEAILALAGGINPALRHISLITDLKGAPMMNTSAAIYSNPRGPWQKLSFGKGIKVHPAAPLTSLELGGDDPTSKRLIQDCFEQCNVSHLQILKLRIPYTHSGLDWLTMNIELPSLQALVLGVDEERIRPGAESEDVDFAAGFLLSLPPLIAIRFLSDVNQDIFDATLARHGTTLRRLWFPPTRTWEQMASVDITGGFCFDISNVDRLQQTCLALEDLRLSTPRSQGGEEEVKIYRSLGRLPRLQTLALSLVCDPVPPNFVCAENNWQYAPNHPLFDDFDDEELKDRDSYRHGCFFSNGHARLFLMNAAFDEPLARSVFDTIQSGKPSEALPLQHLELRPVNGKYEYENWSCVMQYVSQWWLLERNPRDDLQDQVLAKRLRSLGDWMIEGDFDPVLDELEPEVVSMLQRIWPHSSITGGKWSVDWRSFPLSLQTPTMNT